MHDHHHSSSRRSESGDSSRPRRNRGGGGGRRDSQRGGRDSSRGGHSSSRSHSSSHGDRHGSGSTAIRPPSPVKLSFWQKLVNLFSGKPKSSGRASSSRSLGGSSRPSAPAGEARTTPANGNGHRRFESDAPAPSRTPRKPELVEVNSPKIYVGNLSFDASEGDLFELFNGVGKVQNAEIVSNKYTQKSKGFAFVTMLTVDEARRAVTELHDKDFMGRKLVVSGAKTNDMARDSGNSRSSDQHEESAASPLEASSHESAPGEIDPAP